MKGIDLTKITPEERLKQVYEKVFELQARIQKELQVIVYSSTLNCDQVDVVAKSLNLSVMSFQTGSGSNNLEKYAVRVMAENLGEIPFALSCLEIYSPETKSSKPEPENDHVSAMAALTAAVTNSLNPQQLNNFLASARQQGKISDEQFSLAARQFIKTNQELDHDA